MSARDWVWVAVRVALPVLTGCLLAHFLIWTVSRTSEPPTGCGGCSYVEFVRESAAEARDIAAHVFVSQRGQR